MSEPLLYDRERSALDELAHLTSERAEREAALESSFQAACRAAERDLAEARRTIAASRERAVKALDEDWQSAQAEVASRAASHAETLARMHSENRMHVTDYFESLEERARERYKDAGWRLTSYLEAFERRAKEELHSAKAKAAASSKQAAAIRAGAEPLLERVRLGLDDVAPSRDQIESIHADVSAGVPAERLSANFGIADAALLRLQRFWLLNLFTGRGALVWFLLWLVAACLPALRMEPMIVWLVGGAVAALAISAASWSLLQVLARRRVRNLGRHLQRALTAAELAGVRLGAKAESLYGQRQAAMLRKQKKRQRRIDAKYQPIIERVEEKRAFQLDRVARWFNDNSTNGATKRAELFAAAEERHRAAQAEIARTHDDRLAIAEDDYQKRLASARAKHDAGWAELERRWHNGLAAIDATFRGLLAEADRAFPDFTSPNWADRPPAERAPAGIRLGTLSVDLARLPGGLSADPRLAPQVPTHYCLPAYLPFPRRCALLLKARDRGRERAALSLQALMLRFLTALPPGKVRFTIIDPVGLGENFAGFMHLADHDELLVTGRIWTEPAQIEQRLADLTVHMENVIQKYLRHQYASIEEYNAAAGEVAEPFRVLVVANFPTNFTAEAARRLVSIAASGPACGVCALVSVDARQPFPHGFQLADLEQACLNLDGLEGPAFVWRDEVLSRFPLALEEPPEARAVAQVVRTIGAAAKLAGRVEVPFDFIAPPPAEIWTSDSRRGITVPLGRSGATKRQALALGQGTAQHALVAGKTGSGKSTLLHALITNAAMLYSPEELELYLVDFKKGVEFKAYATHRLPHARVVAVESEREFGLSVLQRLDAELKSRGDTFRAARAHDVAGYRDQSGAKLPRILLVVDEFQEFFVEDDKLAQEAALLLDRLVRQGRAFGLHVLLGSQTLGGAYSLARSTIDQMAVRIALQCSEADAQLILSKDNAAARLLSRPGEAIYNDANGRIEGNDVFQVVWLDERRREQILTDLQQRAASQSFPQIVFEGNTPAEIEENPLLHQLLTATAAPPPSRAPVAWLGESVAIKGPATMVFRPQGGANLLLVGQHEEAALSALTAAAVSLAAQFASAGEGDLPSVEFRVLDGTPADDPRFGYLPRLAEGFPHPLQVAAPREAAELLAPLAAEVEKRQKGESADRSPRFLLVYGLQRCRDLRKGEDDFGFGRRDKAVSAGDLFVTLLRDGPAVGVHALVWCDTLPSLNRALDRQTQREFEARVLFQMGATDSSHLIDSPLASRLGRNRALLHREEQAQPEKFRPYGLPSADWLAWAKERLRPR